MRKILRRKLEVTEARKQKYNIGKDTIFKVIFKKDDKSTQLNTFVYFNRKGNTQEVLEYLRDNLMEGNNSDQLHYEIKRIIRDGFRAEYNPEDSSYKRIGEETLNKISFKINSLSEIDYLRQNRLEIDIAQIKEKYQDIKEFEKPINIKEEWEVFEK